MKKFVIISSILVSAITYSSIARTSPAPKVGAQSDDTNMSEEAVLPPTDINGVMVPFDVLIYAQTEYVGHAVTDAEKITLNGSEVYRLRVDRDINTGDYESIYLFYTLEWKLLDEKDMVPPPRPIVNSAEEQLPKETDANDENPAESSRETRQAQEATDDTSQEDSSTENTNENASDNEDDQSEEESVDNGGESGTSGDGGTSETNNNEPTSSQ